MIRTGGSWITRSPASNWTKFKRDKSIGTSGIPGTSSMIREAA